MVRKKGIFLIKTKNNYKITFKYCHNSIHQRVLKWLKYLWRAPSPPLQCVSLKFFNQRNSKRKCFSSSSSSLSYHVFAIIYGLEGLCLHRKQVLYFSSCKTVQYSFLKRCSLNLLWTELDSWKPFYRIMKSKPNSWDRSWHVLHLTVGANSKYEFIFISTMLGKTIFYLFLGARFDI